MLARLGKRQHRHDQDDGNELGHHPQAAGVAVPVRDAGDRVVAALGVVVPNDESAIRAVTTLHAAARGIGRALTGGQNPSR